MALTKVSRGLLTTSIVDNGNATAITIDSSENVTFSGTATAVGLTVNTSSVGGFKVTNEATSGVRLTAYQGTTNSNVRAAYVDAQEFVVSTGAPTGTTVTEAMSIGSTGIIYVNGDGTGGRISGDGSGGLNLQDGNGRQTFKIMSPSSGNTQAMTLDADSNLLVGTTSPLLNSKANFVRSNTTSSAIVVNAHNSAASNTGKSANSIFRGASQGNGADGNLVITDSVANNYYFGGNSAGAYVMANSNGVRLGNGATSWAGDSDERLKDIIEPIENGLEKVSTLRSVIGKYKTDEEDKRRVFLIAQDVQAVLPEAVFENEGNLMLQYTDLIPLLVAAIKEQQATIESLTDRIAELEG